ncbi:hypothetical protein, partial [Heyndrickxia coagulans]|uniref:hypothetical protein n=1 Tax=Heyndrickxia coagulans TaxID=1398 RepID=UPI00214DDB7B
MVHLHPLADTWEHFGGGNQPPTHLLLFYKMSPMAQDQGFGIFGENLQEVAKIRVAKNRVAKFWFGIFGENLQERFENPQDQGFHNLERRRGVAKFLGWKILEGGAFGSKIFKRGFSLGCGLLAFGLSFLVPQS